MSLASLPPEILNIVLGYCSLATIVALLRVNKSLCRDALAILYQNPLQCILRLPDPTPSWALARLSRLLATLTNFPCDDRTYPSGLFQELRARAETMYSVILSSDQEQDTGTTQAVAPKSYPEAGLSGINYLSIVRHIRFPFEVPRAAATSTAREFSIDYHQNENLYLQVLFTWALVDPVAEQLESLTIPVPDIERYIRSVGRFKSLTSVKFDMRVFLPYSEPSWTNYLERIVNFLRLHSLHFREKLEKTSYEGVAAFPWPDILRMMRALPPLRHPLRLVDETLVRFISQPDQTNLEHVRFIHDRIPMNHSVMNMNWRQDLHRLKRFFHRCRSLQGLRWSITDPESFAWAVQEKKDHELENVPGVSSSWSPLVPLKEAILTVQGDIQGKVINDIFTAFGDSLERAYIAYTDLRAKRLLVGNGCHFPRLRRLVISIVNGGPLVIDSEALRLCPALEQLELSDTLSLSHHQSLCDNVQWTPCVFPKATLISLIGSPGRDFHMDTLYSTPGLQKLRLLATIPREPIPGLWDSPRQLSLAWDWRLPRLERISLNADIAYFFDFKWLQYCPMLKKLEIELPSYWRRTLSLDDLILYRDLRDSDKDSQNSTDHPGPNQSPPQFVRSTSLSSLIFTGQWLLKAKVLQTLITKVAPNLSYISEEDCLGFSTQEWIDVMRTGPHLWNVYSHRELTPQKAAAHGLVMVDRISRCPEKKDESKDKGKMGSTGDESWLEGPLFQFSQMEQAYRWKRPSS